eukprot:NODE_22_length_42145_cov_1.310612.p13 type:complete len:362 gc:universal NODE_22_length_42145_cov_1.310612:34277-33192(-)
MVKNADVEFLRGLVHTLFQPFFDIEYDKDFKDDSVCKWQLVSPFGCPSLLFPNRSDLGPCSKNHDIRLKQKYEQDPKKDKYPYEQWFFNYLQRLVLELDKRIKKHQSRLHGFSADIDEENDERWEKIIELDEKINEMITKAEEYGLKGMVEESHTMATQVDQLQADLEQLKNVTKQDDKSFDVCPVCAKLLIVNDVSTNRTGIHIDGKQHQGWHKIREHFKFLQDTRPDLVEESVKQYQKQQDRRNFNDRREPYRPSPSSRPVQENPVAPTNNSNSNVTDAKRVHDSRDYKSGYRGAPQRREQIGNRAPYSRDRSNARYERNGSDRSRTHNNNPRSNNDRNFRGNSRYDSRDRYPNRGSRY